MARTPHAGRLLFALSLIAIAAAARLLPHPPNVTPVAALALLGGATLPSPWSLALPTAAMLLSDIAIGFDMLPVTFAVYGSFAVTCLLGSWLKRNPAPWNIVGASLASSVIFYLVTNAAVWWFSGLYPRTGEGLVLSYFFAIPFFRHTVLGDLAYTAALFAAFQYGPEVASAVRRLLRRPLAQTQASALATHVVSEAPESSAAEGRND